MVRMFVIKGIMVDRINKKIANLPIFPTNIASKR